MPNVITFTSGNTNKISQRRDFLKTTYGLTSAEVRLTEKLLDCLTVSETAKRMNLSASTVKHSFNA